MRSSTALVWAMTVTACTGTEGDILRTPSSPGPGGDASERPRPSPLSSWQIQLTGAPDTSADVQIYTLDLDTPKSVIDGLHGAGRIVICYFSAGTLEPFRDDASRFPRSSLGAALPDYPDEHWIDVRDTVIRSIMSDRVARAADNGCDGVHPSGLAAFLADTGLDFTRADQLAYDRWLTTVAHAQGLSIGLVDGDASLSRDLLADFDWTVVFSCLDSNCSAAGPFTSAGKAAFLIEYGDESRVAEVCPKAKTLGLSAIIKRNSDLDAFLLRCP